MSVIITLNSVTASGMLMCPIGGPNAQRGKAEVGQWGGAAGVGD